MKRLVALLAALLLPLLALPARCENIDTARLEDVDALCAELKAGHANPFTVIAEAEFDRRADDLRARLSGMSDARFYYELRALVASVGDAHTAVDYTDSRYAHLRALPFAVVRMQGRWLAAILPAGYGGLLGWEAAAVEGMPMEEVFARAKTVISFDNEACAARDFSNTINFLDALQFLGVAGEDAQGVTLTLRAADGETRDVFLSAMSEAEITAAAGGFARLAPSAASETAPSGYYRALELDGGSALFIQYNVCQEAPDLPMADFAEAVRGLLRERGYGRVLLDLRYNAGGNSAVIAPLLDVLEEAKAAQSFACFVLIGGDTFSSGVLNAVEAWQRLGAALVGQPTSGSVNAFGELGSADLPHSPIRLYYSTKYFEPLPGYPAGSLMPDVEIEPSLEEYLAGRDVVVERALKHGDESNL